MHQYQNTNNKEYEHMALLNLWAMIMRVSVLSTVGQVSVLIELMSTFPAILAMLICELSILVQLLGCEPSRPKWP